MNGGEESALELFFSSWDLFGQSALAGTFAGALLGVLGVYIVLRRMVFLSAALSQVASLGVALSFWASLTLGLTGLLADPTLGATLATVAATLLLMAGRATGAQGGGGSDALLGLVFLVGAAGTLLVGTQIVQELQDVQTLLFGTAVAVLPEDFWLVVGVCLALGLVQLVGWRGFVAVVFDGDDARVRGLPAASLELALLLSLALALSVFTRVLGALPAFAFSVLPAMAAIRLQPNVPRAMLLAGLLGAASGFGGYLAAFVWELPVGASQTALAVALVALASGWRAIWRR